MIEEEHSLKEKLENDIKIQKNQLKILRCELKLEPFQVNYFFSSLFLIIKCKMSLTQDRLKTSAISITLGSSFPPLFFIYFERFTVGATSYDYTGNKNSKVHGLSPLSKLTFAFHHMRKLSNCNLMQVGDRH